MPLLFRSNNDDNYFLLAFLGSLHIWYFFWMKVIQITTKRNVRGVPHTHTHITFADKGPSSQSYGFSSSHVWMWKLDYKESWVPKIDAFELWCWRRLLRVPWTARRSNLSILKEISQSWVFIGRRWRASCNFSHAWHDWTWEHTFTSWKVCNWKVRL